MQRVAAEAAPTTVLLWLVLAASAHAGDYQLEPTGSSLKFTAVQQGATFESRFEHFTADIRFDPAQPANGRITARIDLGSVDTGNTERDEVLKTADWFAIGRWPEAVFSAEQIVAVDTGFEARGTLSLRDARQPATLRFTWTPSVEGQPARLVGSATLERLTFGVGQGDWRDTAYVGNTVKVQVDIRLVKALSKQ